MMSGLSNLVKRHPLITFFVLTYALTWGPLPLGIFFATGPLLAALIVIPITQGLSGLKELGYRIIRWRVRWYWYVVAIGLPLAIHLLTVVLNLAAGVGIQQHFTSFTGFLLGFALRLINPVDGPVGEEPGWRGFALPGLQSTLSPLASTAILAVLITIWHLPLFLLVGGTLPLSTIVGGVVGVPAFTFVATWLFNHTRGSVLMTILMHDAEGSIQVEGFTYSLVWLAVVIGLVVFDWKMWRGPAAPETKTPQVRQPRRAAQPVGPA